MTRTTFLVVLALLSVGSLDAQDLRPSIPLEKILDAPAELTPRLPTMGWIPGEPGILFEVVDSTGPDTPAQVDRVTVADRSRERLFDARDLGAALRTAGLKVPKNPRLPRFTFVGRRTIRLVVADAVFRWDIGAKTATRVLDLVADATATALAPDDTAVAAIVDDDLLVRDADGATRRVTFDGAPQDIVYGGAAHRAEFGIHDGLWWDPAGRRLAFSREDMRPNAVFPYVDYRTRPAESEHGRYPMAGSSHSKVTIGVFDRTTARLVYLEHGPAADLYWTNVTFSPDGDEVWVALVDRAQSNVELVAFDATTGARLRTVLQESDPEWIEPEHGPIFLPDGAGFLWFSSRDGYRHLWRHAMDGTMQWRETQGHFDISEFAGFSADDSHAYVVASGEDPRSRHLFSVRLGRPTPPMMLIADPRPKMEKLTRWGEGWHDCAVAEDGAVLDRWSSIYRPGFAMVRNPNGSVTMITHVPDPLATYRTGGQQMFAVRTEDGAVLYGHVLLPPNPDTIRKHPVLLYVYGGPKAQLVRDRWMGGASLWLQHMASQGYVVVRLDGRGTPNRGIEFEQAVHRHLGEIEVLDQLQALEWVRANVACADTRRVGVHGWSFGGYMTLRLMLLSPDQFVCGVAGAPVTDWQRYETGYTERYMDTPAENRDGYEASAVLPLVGDLKGRLLLVQGTDDHTVMWSNSMAFLRRAIDEGVLIDLMAYPMAKHGLGGRDRKHFHRLMTRYFLEHLPPPAGLEVPAGAAQGETDADDR